MIAHTLIVAVLLALEPAAVPAPEASQTPLREITRVRATTPLCRDLAADATEAIDDEQRFDARLGDAEYALSVVDLDSSGIAKMRGTNDVRARYVELAANVAASRKLMKAFEQRLKDAPTPEARRDLQTFADALGGALHHQQSLADELGRFLAYADTHDPIDDTQHDRLMESAIANVGNGSVARSQFDASAFGPTAGVTPQLSTVAKAASTTLAKRALPLADDEKSAADRIDPAFSGC